MVGWVSGSQEEGCLGEAESVAEQDAFCLRVLEKGKPLTGCLLIFDFLRVSQKARDVWPKFPVKHL